MNLKITIEPESLNEAIRAIRDLSEGLVNGPYSYTLTGITNRESKFPLPQYAHYCNAYDFLVDQYDVTRGALRLIAAVSAIISDGIAQEEISMGEWKEGA